MKVKLVYDIDPDIVAELRARTEEEFLEGTLSPEQQALVDITIMISNNPSYIDDTNGKVYPVSGFVCVGIPKDKAIYLCPVEKDSVGNLRPFYIEKNQLRLSTRMLPGLYLNNRFTGEGDIISEAWV